MLFVAIFLCWDNNIVPCAVPENLGVFGFSEIIIISDQYDDL
jgi:hypothetical protein